MTQEERDREVLMCSSSRNVNITLNPVWHGQKTVTHSINGFKLNQLVWDKEHKCIGQIMAIYEGGEVRLDSDGCVDIESLEPLLEKHFRESDRLAPSTFLRMALTIQRLQRSGAR